MSFQAIQDLVERVAALELEEAELSEQRRVLHQRMAIFPRAAHDEAEQALSARRLELHRAIDMARIELASARLAQRDAADSVTSF
jgi:hypothetical protein